MNDIMDYFWKLAEDGDGDKLRTFLEDAKHSNLDINHRFQPSDGPEARTTLQIAVIKRLGTVANLLLEKGANANQYLSNTDNGESLLQFALRKQYPELATALIKYGANVNAPAGGPNQETALHTALRHEDVSMVEVLLEKGAKIEALNGAGKSVVAIAKTCALDSLSAQLVKAHDFHSQDPRPRRLIVCCDGTWMKNDTDQPLSNVARIALCLTDCDRRGKKKFIQVVHYQSGVGTSSWGALNLYEGAFAQAIGQDIRDAYGFICDNYATPDDEIILIGFSRGAFTVRALASLIADIGVLKGAGRYSLSKVYELWEKQLPPRSLGDGPLTSPAAPTPRASKERKTSHQISDLEHYVRDLQKFRLTNNQTVNIKVCAVWDTVAAIGAKLPKFLPQIPSKKLAFVDKKTGSDAKGRPRVENVFQALALDEKRFHFQPMLWQRHQTQNLTQCWFRGSHSDVGGGNANSGLANLSLAWMMAKLEPFALFDAYRISQLSQNWRFIPHLFGRDSWESKKPFRMPPQNFRVYNSYTKRYWLGMSEERHPGADNNGKDTNESVHISVSRLGDDPNDSRIVHKNDHLKHMAKAQWVDGDLEHKILKAWRKSEGDEAIQTSLDRILGADAGAALQVEEPVMTSAI